MPRRPHKVCTGCGEDKPLEEYDTDSRYKLGVRSQCRVCRAVAQWDSRWAYHLMSKYGITLEQYDEMFQSQGGKCAICLRPETRFTGRVRPEILATVPPRLVVDHNHETGEVRGLLCHRCNVGIGQLDDDIDRLREAIRYLEKYL